MSPLARGFFICYHWNVFTALIFFVVIGILVFVHELGHFVTAKRAGMKVEEFGFGFPPRLFGVKKGETIYSVNAIPFGGFVKIMGEDGSERDNSRSFAGRPAHIRAIVIVAGVVMNLLLAILLLALGNAIGLRVGLDDKLTAIASDQQVQIIQVTPGSPAEEAGLKLFDALPEFVTVTAVQEFINANKGRAVTLQIKRGSEQLAVKLVPRSNPPPGEGAVGIALALTGVVRYPWYQAIYRGLADTYNITSQTALGYGTIIKNLFVTGQAGAELSGPIGIAVVTGQAVRLGFSYLLQLMALISVNLAILNIIPFPALDGGRLLFIGIEKLKGSPVPKQVEIAVNGIGFVLLILLMFYVTVKDVIKFF